MLCVLATAMMNFVDPSIPFIIISKDSGFDNLMLCLKKNRDCWRAFAYIGTNPDSIYKKVMAMVKKKKKNESDDRCIPLK